MNATHLEEVNREDWAVVLYLCLPLALTVAHDFVDANFLVPARHSQKVLLVVRIWVESEGRDAIFGRAPELDVLLEVAERVARRRRLRSEKARHRRGYSIGFGVIVVPCVG